MAEFTMMNKKNVKHWVTIDTNDICIKVIRLQVNGGTPQTIIKNVDEDITFNAGLETIRKLVELDDELFTMISGYTT